MSTETGTFISMDTYEGSIYDPDSLHKYLYANGNPVKYNDPSGNFFSAVGAFVATTINTIINNHEEIHAMAIISGVTSSIIAKALGKSDEEVAEAFFEGYFTGGILGSVMYVVAAYQIMSIAEMCMLMASENFVVSVVMTIAAINSDNTNEILVYGTLAVLSFGTFCKLYDLNGKINLTGDLDSRTIIFDNSNPDGSKHYLHRPYIRKSTIDGVNAETIVDYNTGEIWDDISGKWVDPANVELGHRQGFEFWRMRDWAEAQGMTQAEFNEFMNNSDFYAWQDIICNRSHAYEQH